MSSDHQPPGAANDHSAATADGVRRSGLLQAVWFTIKAIEIRLRFIAVLLVIGLVIGYWDTIRNYWDKWTRPTSTGESSLAESDEFYCPMHPSVVRDKPDAGGAIPKCPICGMPLSKRAKGESVQLPEGILSRVQLSPYRVTLAGIQTAEAELRPLTLDVRTVGNVTVDERQMSRIVVRAAGYVEKLYLNESFVDVQAGEPLAEIYSPDLFSAAQELLVAHRGTSTQLAEAAREKLRLLGVARTEIDDILRTGDAAKRLVIRSPRSGKVFVKRVVEGDHVEAGQTLFEVADLSTVWIEGEVFEKHAAMLQLEQPVQATVEALPGQVFKGHLSLVHPNVETATRTVRVRFELDNSDHTLKPGMFATVSLSTPMLEIEPFRSKLAGRQQDQLAAGAGDTQAPPPAGTEVQHAADHALLASQRVCPVTGNKLGSMGQPVRASAAGHTVYLCCSGCQEDLASRPDYYLGRLHTVSEAGVLAIPEHAVIDTGELTVVYLERQPGVFEGVAVTLGPRAGGYYPVIDGLLPGDRVVAAGAFLVDAETRLNPAAAAAYFGSGGGTPSGGRGASGSSPATTADAAGGRAERIQANLQRLPEADRLLAEQQEICPVTDLPLGSMGVPHKLIVQGQTVYVCCEHCAPAPDRDPQEWLDKLPDRNRRQGSNDD